jgi:predicted RNase H-like HicB family nuclease
MLSDYIAAAMKRAKYKIAEDNTFFGEIPGFSGVWANRDNLEDCRAELQEVLEGWLVLGLRKGAKLPEVDGISLSSASPVA